MSPERGASWVFPTLQSPEGSLHAWAVERDGFSYSQGLSQTPEAHLGVNEDPRTIVRNSF